MSDLPYDSQIKWLGFEGSRYVNTKYTPNENTRIEFRMRFPDNTRNNTGFYVFSARERGTSLMNCGMRIRKPNTIYAQYTDNGASKEIRFAQSRNLATTDIVDGDFSPPNAVLNVNGSRLGSCTIGTFTGNSLYPLLVCGYHLGTQNPSIQVYSFQIYEDDSLIHDYIPVRVESTGYLYDQVGESLYSVSGTGTGAVTLGPDLGGGVQRCTN